MHILLIHQAFAAINEPGGTRHHELARYLVQRGHQVTVIASPVSYLTGSIGGTTGQQEPGITILRTYTYAALHRSFVHRVFSFLSFMASSLFAGLRVRQVDLVWGTSPSIFQGATAWAVARLKRAPFLFEVRDLWPAFAIGVGILRSPVLIRMSEWLERFLYTHADQILVNSPGFIAHIRERGGERIALVPNGADPRMFDPMLDGQPFRQVHDLEGKTVALYAGAHGMSNDLDIVLDAAKLLRERSDIRLVFLGDGKEKPALQERAAREGLDNVLFLPPVPKDQMKLALAAADLCIAILKPIPLYATVYPNKVFDYMAAGRPVLLAIDGVIREVVEHARAGLFVEPGNATALAAALRQMADDPQQAAEMGQRGRRYVEENFDRAVLAERLGKIFEGMVSRSNPG